MEEPPMEPPAIRFQKYVKEQLKKFGKNPLAIPFVVAVGSLVYYLVTIYLASLVCLSGLISPLVLIGLCWYFDMKAVKKLLAIGIATTIVGGFVLGAGLTNQYQHVPAATATSDDKNHTLIGGGIQPVYGGKQTVFKFNVTVHLKDRNVSVDSVCVIIARVEFPSYSLENRTMTNESWKNTSSGEVYINYAYNTTVSTAFNTFIFNANISGTWISAADHSVSPPSAMFGPVYKDTGAVMATLVPIALYETVLSFFSVFGIIVVMIWWMRRTRQMRKNQLEKWEQERAKEQVAKPKEEVKVSLQRRAMGLESEGTFVCSECGADVPADATVCPKCGEKFE